MHARVPVYRGVGRVGGSLPFPGSRMRVRGPLPMPDSAEPCRDLGPRLDEAAIASWIVAGLLRVGPTEETFSTIGEGFEMSAIPDDIGR
jgi:hypothetical protein